MRSYKTIKYFFGFIRNFFEGEGVVTLKEMIEQEYKVEIPTSIFVAELRTINQVASYIAQ